MASHPLLSMQAIDKRFGVVPALRASFLEVEEGEVMALIGENGAGKSTMIKVLNGFCQKDAGEITFDGRPWQAASPQEAQRNGISTIFQEINLIPFRTITENIYLGRELKHRGGFLAWRRMHEGARRLLEAFGVDIDVGAPLGQFSTAIQQMVAIARAISFEAKLVIMDESTSSLDEQEVQVLFQTIRRLKAQGVAVVFVSHKLDELYAVCDRVTVMRDGKTVAVASMAEMDKLRLVATMLGRDLAEVRRQGATAFSEAARPPGAELLSVDSIAVSPKVKEASVSVRAGEIVGLAGLLGSGRTETARAIFGAEPHQAGRISFEGKPQHFADPRQAIAAGLGFCSEDRKHEGIIPRMSVRENMTLALLPALARSGIVNEREQRRIVLRFIKDIGIKCASAEQPIRELSGGNQQKVLLARWLCMNPKLLILDEPTRGIDVGATSEIQKLVRRLANDGLGVLMISSEIEEILEGADRIFILRDGRTVGQMSRADASEATLMAAMAHGSGDAAPHGGEH
ncbi:monosaccharide ABC transporter ATP-binding protein, CUT2 family [Arboricoccus pini]|uniref:Monosaccharide ABC transporter ATP-binding protein, CUT2 family n=1 Tax=Arboricoccus pini TaxID=1963835 RepID=A0A212RJ33_9PROT|nr:sugar ABC transporter ATP-binding protein [Arboricoccus pini]SNB72306.1 monosaccharide ABC transporter ATP-binding protein, CUT2 family [Arboricoccus pini]